MTGNNRQFSDLWTSLTLDSQADVLEINNPDDRLFFGRRIVPGRNLAELAGDGNRPQADMIARGLRRAQREKRNVYVEYLSSYADGQQVRVAAHLEYLGDGTVRLHATGIDAADFRRAREADAASAPRKSGTLMETVYECLPIGVEIYDRNGRLIEMNPAEMEIMGIRDKGEVMDLDLFENPNIPDEIKSRLKAGEDVRFTVEYDFSRAGKEYFETTKSKSSHFDATISVVRDAAGRIDKYLVISQDITERVSLQRDYEKLYNQTMTILDSLPVGVELYANDGTIRYLNATDCRTFGIDRETVLQNPLNIHDNPNLPPEVKEAVRDGVKVHTHFPYRFDRIVEKGYYDTAKTDMLHIECNGQPIIGAAGEVENYVFIVEDSTEAVRSQQELRHSKRKTELAMQAADIMLWEFDVDSGLFFSENEPINGYDRTSAITTDDYTDSLHPDDRAQAIDVLGRMAAGEDCRFSFEARVMFPGNPQWQYCTISGSPYEKNTDGRVMRYVGSRKNNTELQKKKQLQEVILNCLPLPIHIKDVEDDFRYTFCNEESKRMFGTCVNKTAYDVMDMQQSARIEKTDMEVFTSGTPYFGKERIVLKDGRSYETIVRKSVIYDRDKRLLLTVRWDESQQNELERRSKVLSLSVDALNAYTWFYDTDTRVLSFGDGFERTGRDAAQVNSIEKFARCIHPDDRQRFSELMTSVLEQDNADFAVEYRIDLTGQGVYEWWECRGILETSVRNDTPCKYMFGMDINIESHKKTELTLLENREALNKLVRQNELVLNNTNSGLAYITMDYIVQWENVSVCSTSLSHEAYKKGEPCYRSAHNRATPCDNCVMRRAMQSRQMEQIKFRMDKRTVEVFATPVFIGDHMDGIVIRVDDVTDRERMIGELRQAKAMAEESDKLKSAFLANMSHEIRTPLNAIVGFSDLLVSSSDRQEKEEYMQIINNNNELLLKLINDILDLSKIEAGSVELKYEEFDLAEYFDTMVSSMRQRVSNPDVKLVAVNPYASCRVKLDRNRIAQVMTNYVTNSIKYTPKGFIEMGYACVDEGIRFYVKDSGIGIPDEKRDRVFHRFEKLDEFAQGTGLGLSICKAIAESMGGSVGFESRYGEGSLFWAIMPCDPEIRTEEGQPAASGGPEAVSGADAGRRSAAARKTILVAEDIASNYLLVSALLRRDYDLVHAVNGEEAVSLAKSSHADLVLMDMKMPLMDGLTATAEIRKFDTDLPIIALTAHAFESDRKAALAAGCNDYLVKPIDKAKLMAMLRKYGVAPSGE